MRGALPLLCLALVLCQGCFVFDELDKSKAMLPKKAPAAAAETAPAEPEPAPTRSGPGPLERLQKWWAKRSEPPPRQRDPADVMVRCELHGERWYTHRFDCLARGGTPAAEG